MDLEQSYESLKADLFQVWEENLKQKENTENGGAPEELVSALTAALAECREGEVANWQRLCLELNWRVVTSGTEHASATISLLKSLEIKEDDQAVVESLADSLWFVSSQVTSKPAQSRGKAWTYLSLYTKNLVSSGIVSSKVLQTVLPEDLMVAAGLFKDGALFTKKIKKLNTDLVYRQQKYNLLREESEGWSKFLVLLADPPHDAEAMSDESGLAVQQMLELIGCFDLDPNRALDLVLETVEAQLENDSLTSIMLPRYLTMIKQFKEAALPHLIGFKIAKRRVAQALSGKSGDKGVFRLAAVLIACGVLDLKDLFAHFDCGLEKLAMQQASIDRKKMERAKSFGVISLSSKDDKKEKAPEKKEDFAVLNSEILELLEAALSLRLWGLASGLFDILEANLIEGASHPGVRSELINILDWQIKDIYASQTQFCLKLGNKKPSSLKDPIDLGLAGSLTKPADLDGLIKAMEPVILKLGIHLHHDISLFTKFCRVTKVLVNNRQKYLKTTTEEKRLLRLFETIVLPALSFLTHHCAASFEVWEALKDMPYEWRYGIYTSWVGEGLEREALQFKHLDVSLAELESGRSTRDVLKRLSKENVKQTGRQLAKVAHANPHVLFHAVLSQIQSYDNLIQPIVDALKFMTPLALDVLSHSLITHLGAEKDKMKGDGLFVSQWLSFLSQFVGVLYRKFCHTELQGLLVFLVNRLQNGHSLDLVVLKELLTRMGSVEMPGTELSEKQVNGMAGGELLRAETVSFGIRDKVNKRAANRLREAFFSSNTALPLLVLIAQQRQHILYETETTHLKLIGWLFDTCESVLSHLVDFLSHPSCLDEYLKVVPSISSLVQDYKLPPSLAFMIARPLMREALRKGTKDTGPYHKWCPTNENFEGEVKKLLPDEGWEALTPTLYITFWSLNLYDVYCPQETYEEEITRLQNTANAMETEANRDESAKAKRKEASKLASAAAALEEELEAQQMHCNFIHALLLEKKSKYFEVIPPDLYKVITDRVIMRCAYPRLVLGAEDALYTAKFFQLLHEISTPKFSTLQYYDRVFKDLVPTVFCSTETEAASLGSFFNATLGTLKRWRFDETAYKQEAESRPGFSINFIEDEGKRATFNDFNRVFDKWQARIGRVFMNCLKSGKYMAVRAAMLCLSRLVDVFPLRKRICAVLLNEVAPFKTDDRPDLRVMANRYWAMLEGQKSKMLDDSPAMQEEAKKEKSKLDDQKSKKGKIRDLLRKGGSKTNGKDTTEAEEKEAAARTAAKKSLAQAKKPREEKKVEKTKVKKRERDDKGSQKVVAKKVKSR